MSFCTSKVKDPTQPVGATEPKMPNLDGQDDALNELVLAKQWKQALILCEKKLKKGNKNDYLLVCVGPSILTDQ